MKIMTVLGTGEAARQGKTGNLVGQGEMEGEEVEQVKAEEKQMGWKREENWSGRAR